MARTRQATSTSSACFQSLQSPARHTLKSTSSHASSYSKHSASPASLGLDDSDGGSRDVRVLPFAEHACVLQAQEECRSLLSGNAVSVVEDEDVKEEVVEVSGPEAELVFATRNIFRYLVLFVKSLDQFFAFQLEVLDDKQQYRTLKVTNARSLARVEGASVQLPLAFGGPGGGWRYLCMDLQQLTAQAFGTQHVTTTHVRIGGNCRLLRVFFQDELYSDAELPAHLTFLGG
ncbi:hypothetical protein PybrP1_001123 [[Pythium] brassicae (nom. inval.)]|nr:hypothetical protein PybrP1_001123 [[Pythium] brassicae (nom. inval.)]